MILSASFFINKNIFTFPQFSNCFSCNCLCFQHINHQKKMGQFWTLLTHLHALLGPVLMLLYPLYASVQAMETDTKLDDEQWLAYWILYSFLTLMEMVLEPVLTWIPIWYEIKLVFVAWLVLPQLRGAAFIYNRFVREKLMKVNDKDDEQTSKKTKNSRFNIVKFIRPKKMKHED